MHNKREGTRSEWERERNINPCDFLESISWIFWVNCTIALHSHSLLSPKVWMLPQNHSFQVKSKKALLAKGSEDHLRIFTTLVPTPPEFFSIILYILHSHIHFYKQWLLSKLAGLSDPVHLDIARTTTLGCQRERERTS